MRCQNCEDAKAEFACEACNEKLCDPCTSDHHCTGFYPIAGGAS